MKELDPFVFLVVFMEMLGPFLWVLLAAILLVIMAFVALLIREKRIHASRIVWSQLLGLLGGAASLVMMANVSSSGYTDAAGPIDWLLILAVFGAGMLATALTIYTLVGWFTKPSRTNTTLES